MSSHKLYDSMCSIVGSETIVKYRRKLFKIHDLANNSENKIITQISSGSKAEGLDMVGSDMDIMYVDEALTVHFDPTQKPILLLSTDFSAPGYVQLILNNFENYYQTFKFTIFDIISAAVATEIGVLIRNDVFKTFCKTKIEDATANDFMSNRYFDEYGFYQIHGPCVSTIDESFDFALCLRCVSWPPIAYEWITRSREWPMQNIVNEIVSQGVLIVPIGSKFRSPESNPYEWRISFSLAEKLLVHSLNHTQLLCYAYLKMVLKNKINRHKNIKNILCSYFMKTVLFWLIEEIELSFWVPAKFKFCLTMCLRRLIYWIIHDTCPNYFIPDNNMLDGKLGKQTKEVLLSELTSLYKDPNTAFGTWPAIEVNSTCNDQEEDIAIYPLLPYTLCGTENILRTSRSSEVGLSSFLDGNLNCLSGLDKQLYLLFKVYSLQMPQRLLPCNINVNNKTFYNRYEQLKFFSVFEMSADSLSSWLYLASMFYETKQYIKALHITQYVLYELTPDKEYITRNQSISKRKNEFQGYGIKFIKRLKYSTMKDVVILGIQHSLFHISSLLPIGLPYNRFPPAVFTHFLCFMCYHQLQDIPNMNDSLNELKTTIQENYFISSEKRTLADVVLIEALLRKKHSKKLDHTDQNIEILLAENRELFSRNRRPVGPTYTV